LADLVDLRQVPQILPEQERIPQPAPGIVEPRRGLQKRLGEPAEAQQQRNQLCLAAKRGPDRALPDLGPVQLGHGKRVHAVGEVPAHQVVSFAPEEAQTRASRDHDAGLLGIRVGEPFEEIPPAAVLVQLVEHHVAMPLGECVEPQVCRHGIRTGSDDHPVRLTIPGVVPMVSGAFPGRGRLAHLCGQRQHGHLPVLGQAAVRTILRAP